MKITVLGAGKMGLSFAKSFLKFDLVKPEDLHLITRNLRKKSSISKIFPKSRLSSFEETSTLETDLLAISVKPQDFSFIAANLPFAIPEDTLVLSIMAGISIQKIQNTLQHRLVVRAMPNSPTLIGMGITGYTAAPEVPKGQLIQAERLMNATGRSVYLEDEELLDGVTAISGSGPAYFFYLVEAMVKAGTKMGIEENLSKLLVQQTMLGAYHLINNSDKSLEELIQDVASKGGTTEAALKVFSESHLTEALQNGIFAAENRAKELNN